MARARLQPPRARAASRREPDRSPGLARRAHRAARSRAVHGGGDPQLRLRRACSPARRQRAACARPQRHRVLAGRGPGADGPRGDGLPRPRAALRIVPARSRLPRRAGPGTSRRGSRGRSRAPSGSGAPRRCGSSPSATVARRRSTARPSRRSPATASSTSSTASSLCRPRAPGQGRIPSQAAAHGQLHPARGLASVEVPRSGSRSARAAGAPIVTRARAARPLGLRGPRPGP